MAAPPAKRARTAAPPPPPFVGNAQVRTAADAWLAAWTPGARPLLLSGPSGVGKSMLARLVAEKGGYAVASVSAGAALGAQALTAACGVAHGPTARAGTLDAFFGARRTLLVIEDVDAVQRAADAVDAARAASLQRPVIMTAGASLAAGDAKMRTLASACTDLRLARPPSAQVDEMLRAVVAQERLTVAPVVLAAAAACGDVRQALERVRSGSGAVDERLEGARAALPRLLEFSVARMCSLARRLEARAVDAFMVDAYVHEYYAAVAQQRWRAGSRDEAEALARAADALSAADTVGATALAEANFGGADALAGVLVATAAFEMMGRLPSRLDFPRLPGHVSALAKRRRSRVRTLVVDGTAALFCARMLAALERKDIGAALDALDACQLARADVETAFECARGLGSQLRDFASIPAVTRSALTRACTERAGEIKQRRGAKGALARAGAGAPVDADEGAAADETE